MKIALVQVASPEAESVDARRERVGAMVRSAGGADLVVLPELWNIGYSSFDRYQSGAEDLDGPTLAAAREWARDLGCHLHVGSLILRSANGLLHNTAVLLDPAGSIAHVYRKVHVFGYRSLESELLARGEGVSVVQTPFGVLGATTCYDLRFPELWRDLVDVGARIVVVPAAWPASRLDHWRTFTRCRAIEEQIILVACNAVGSQAGAELAGHSSVIDPWGEVLVEAGADEGLTTVSVDPGVVEAVRKEFPVLQDRVRDFRPGLTATGLDAL